MNTFSIVTLAALVLTNAFWYISVRYYGLRYGAIPASDDPYFWSPQLGEDDDTEPGPGYLN